MQSRARHAIASSDDECISRHVLRLTMHAQLEAVREEALQHEQTLRQRKRRRRFRGRYRLNLEQLIRNPRRSAGNFQRCAGRRDAIGARDEPTKVSESGETTSRRKSTAQRLL